MLGFIPMALSHPAFGGTEVQRPLAPTFHREFIKESGVIGDLVTSTLLTLFILPVVYQWIAARSDHRAIAMTNRNFS